ncbi:hypothetical protein BJ508DRAFT_2601 [Ascobolus immersus RN42]|uniref:Uncharacterized protein n=1 Tax=Ascobolus immersus RN42 TaxID=1160509 RepID=A0A3N4IPJ2_ASCIM|nr:hypothetical protein BJ508DRAFT_2601 [Ascobolus immersus RN42]
MERPKTEEIVPIPKPGSPFKTFQDLPNELYDHICDELVRATESPIGKDNYKVLKKYIPRHPYSNQPPELGRIRYRHPLLAFAAVSKHYEAVVESWCGRQCTSGKYVVTTPLKEGKKNRSQFLYRLWTQCAYCHVRSVRRGTIARFLNLCANCDKQEFPKITLSQAKRKYGLTEEQLKDEHNGIRRGTYHSQGHDCTHYDLGDVIRYAERIHNMPHDVWLARKKHQKTSQEEAARAKKKRIVDALEAGLLANGLALRITALGPTVQTISTKSPYICMPAFTAKWICPEAKQPAHFVKYEYLLQQATVRVAYDSYNRLFNVLPTELVPANQHAPERSIPNFAKTLRVGPEWNTTVRNISLPNIVLFHLFTLDFSLTGLTCPEEYVHAYLSLITTWEPGKLDPTGNHTPWSILHYPIFIRTPDFPPGLAAEDDAIQRHINRLYSHYPKAKKIEELKAEVTKFLGGDWRKLADKDAYVEKFMRD